jgi:hypothetical protein
MRLSYSLCVCVPPTSTFECLNQSFWHLVCTIWCYLSPSQRILHKTLPSVCVSGGVPLSVARQRLCNHVPSTTNICNNRRIAGCIVFCKARVVAKESLWAYLCVPSSLLGSGSVNMFSRQRRIVGGGNIVPGGTVKRSWPHLRFPSGISLEGLRNITKALGQDSRCGGRHCFSHHALLQLTVLEMFL